MLRTLHENINSDSTTANALFAVTLAPLPTPTHPPPHFSRVT